MIQISLPPNQQLAAPGKWPVVGEKSPRSSSEPWSVSVSGLVERPWVWFLDELRELPQVELTVDIHCVTRWSKLGQRFSGVSLRTILDMSGILPQAQFASFVARSERVHSTSLRLSDALDLGVLVALEYDGSPLEESHGGPIRIVTPDRYFYKSVKWLERIELLTEDRLGFWESESGYHNTADPWKEQRYLAANLDRNLVKSLLEARDFSNRDLRSINAAGMNLSGLNARNALLRDADFRNAKLQGACFDNGNLSNAHLEGADLRNTSFKNADVEGADFRGSDLRGADFTGASLFGATFCPISNEIPPGDAIMDASTIIPPETIEVLTPEQQAFVLAKLSS